MYLLGKIKKRPRVRMNVRKPSVLRSAKHLKWIRSLPCIVPWCERRDIECAHARMGLPAGEQAGVSQKPSDVFCFPACRAHHDQQHRVGEESFAREYLPPGVSLPELAIRVYAAASPDQEIRERAKELRGEL